MPNFGLDDQGYPPVDSNEFLELQMRAATELNKLINGYVAKDFKGDRTNHAVTQSRRGMLRAIKVESNIHKDKNGNGLLYWDKMLTFAMLAIEQFRIEDIQRGA